MTVSPPNSNATSQLESASDLHVNDTWPMPTPSATRPLECAALKASTRRALGRLRADRLPPHIAHNGAVQSLRLHFAWDSGCGERTSDSRSDGDRGKSAVCDSTRPAERCAYIIPAERRVGFSVTTTVDYLEISINLDPELLPDSPELRELPGSATAEAWHYEESSGWKLARVIYDECTASGTEASPYVETAAKLLTMYITRALLTRRAPLTALRQGGLPPSILGRACGYMESRLRENPSLQDIAATADLSAGHFSLAFKQSMGVPPHTWMRRQRIEKAKTLLRDTRLDMSEIAARIGYSNQSAFGVAFRRETGLIPTQWRRYRLV
jgi:AraC family transcriptional regulator